MEREQPQQPPKPDVEMTDAAETVDPNHPAAPEASTSTIPVTHHGHGWWGMGSCFRGGHRGRGGWNHRENYRARRAALMAEKGLSEEEFEKIRANPEEWNKLKAEWLEQCGQDACHWGEKEKQWAKNSGFLNQDEIAQLQNQDSKAWKAKVLEKKKRMWEVWEARAIQWMKESKGMSDQEIEKIKASDEKWAKIKREFSREFFTTRRGDLGKRRTEWFKSKGLSDEDIEEFKAKFDMGMMWQWAHGHHPGHHYRGRGRGCRPHHFGGPWFGWWGTRPEHHETSTTEQGYPTYPTYPTFPIEWADMKQDWMEHHTGGAPWERHCPSLYGDCHRNPFWRREAWLDHCIGDHGEPLNALTVDSKEEAPNYEEMKPSDEKANAAAEK